MIPIEWSDLKTLIDAGTLNYRHVETSVKFLIYAFDGPLQFQCTIYKPGDDATEYDTSYKAQGLAKSSIHEPFAAKSLPGGKKIFRRKHGVSQTITSGSTEDIEFTVPYGQAKITQAEIIGCAIGDSVDLTVHDDASGTYTTVPNQELNQFGFDVQMPDGMYRDKSEYDADLYNGMVVKLSYTNNGQSDKDISVNITLHEVV